MAQVIPVVCARYPNVHFIVGGDGNKKLLLEEMRVRRSGGPQHRQTGRGLCGGVWCRGGPQEKHQLHDRLELLGGVPHAQVGRQAGTS